MSDYTKAVDFAAKDALSSGNPSKTVVGTELDDEFDAIAVAVATKADKAGPALTGTTTVVNITASGTITSNGTFKADTISEVSAAAGVTIDGLLIKDSGIPEAAVTAHEAALTITESQVSDLQSYLLNVVEDTTPQLGGDLDTNGNDITGAFSTTGAVTHAAAVTFGAEIVETVYALSGTTPALDPANGTIQTWTLTGNSTPTDSLSAGESITLKILDGTAYTITWPTMEWVGGTAPTLDTTNDTWVVLWKVGSTLYGALVGVSS